MLERSASSLSGDSVRGVHAPSGPGERRRGNPCEALKAGKFYANVKSIIITKFSTLSDQYHILNLNHVVHY